MIKSIFQKIITLFNWLKTTVHVVGENINNGKNSNNNTDSQIRQHSKLKTQNSKLLCVYLCLICSICFPFFSFAQNLPQHQIAPQHAEQFGKMVVQDSKGRLKPMNTLTSELLRKIARKSDLYGLSSDQIVLGMMVAPRDWYDVPLIKSGMHETIKERIPIQGKLAAYSDFFDEKNAYKLQDLVREAYAKEPRDRGVLDKELQKIDERINIMSMIFSGRIMQVFPVPDDPNNTWISPADVGGGHGGHKHQLTPQSPYMEKFYPAYVPTIQRAMHDNDWNLANQLLAELDQYQRKTGAAVYPSDMQIKAELLLNRMDIFNRLTGVYAILALVFLTLLFTSVFKPNLNLEKVFRIAFGLFAAAVFFHTLGLGLRWYVSGRAPWSNGYESMIYIGFTTVLAGLIFSRKSIGGLTATNVLAATIMMVAALSYLDPEITPLVPVLKSYWLTIHVSLEAGSYGFLMLGAIIGVLNLILMIFATKKSEKNVNRVTSELTLVSEMTLYGGLFMISVGTYLGGVWANESWGRYWGWDAKETWALVTILIYSFILHMRFIPGLRSKYAFNVATLFGFASVVMTYFGVNYYLSGLHSYAAGDPLPIPTWVYYTAAFFVLIAVLAAWRQRGLRAESAGKLEQVQMGID